MSNETKSWLDRIRSEATVFAEAYRLRLVGRLWWANLLFVVLPAVLATAAAVFAAKESGPALLKAPVAAWLAGGAAVLAAVHRALKCEEYQTECLRLSQAYRRIAIWADSTRSNESEDGLKELAAEYATLTRDAKAPLPTGYLRKARESSNNHQHGQTNRSLVHEAATGQ